MAFSDRITTYEVYTTPSTGLNIEAREVDAYQHQLGGSGIMAWADCDLSGTPMWFDDAYDRKHAKDLALELTKQGFHL